jgi:site-specific DNA recombinase
MKPARSQAKVTPKVRCAVYTRKSSEEGLDMEFNSLDAQREACEAYIASQKPEGWVLVHDRYDDGGVSGGTLERPALKRLLADIERGQVDVVVVYKIDRLSRSLMDFAKLVEVFERRNVTFVSVTQSFNTTTSMGRLTLNILLSFAQFEREVIGERIRDKFAASRKKGMWMGGFVPLGYRVENRKLVIAEEEAATVRMIFERFLKVGSATLVARALVVEGVTTRRGKPIDKGFLYKLLNNRVYIGDAVHKGTAYPGEHEAIISRDLWNRVHGILQESPAEAVSGRVEGAASRDLGPLSLTRSRVSAVLCSVIRLANPMRAGRRGCSPATPFSRRVSSSSFRAALARYPLRSGSGEIRNKRQAPRPCGRVRKQEPFAGEPPPPFRDLG